jgi:hypothetical protein
MVICGMRASICEAHAEIKGFLRVLGLSSAGARVVDELIRLVDRQPGTL